VKQKRFSIASSLILTLAFAVSVVSVAQQNNEALLSEMRWRAIGPTNFAGRVVDVEAVENDFRHVIVASASGGVWKSMNAGTTWEPIFDRYASASIGDIAIFQRDPNILWVGTGEANNRNSVAWGDGIYKSTDGGKTFTHGGLRETFQIARIVTHPTDPNIVYVAAVGNLWGYSGDRGLFKTTDGGENWTKLAGGLPADGKTGAIDVVMDPSNPNVLYAAFYERLRRPWRFDSGGPNGGIFKTTDAGKTWIKLTAGLPSGPTGRIGLDIYRKNPKILMAIVEHGFQPAAGTPDYEDMSKLGTGIYRSEDAGKTWKFLNRYNNRPFYYSQIRINPLDDQRVYVLTTNIMLSSDGGKTFRPGGESFEGGLDFHAMWIDPTNKDRYYLGKDKGLTLTYDHGASFILFDNMPIGQFYAIGVDMRDPYFVCGGTQDNGSWCGPHFSRDVRGTLADSWWKMHWGDGMFAQIDPTDWRKIYTEAENGSARRYDALSRRVEMSRPTAQNIVNLKESGAEPRSFRFNWRAPLVMSPTNPLTLYLGGNFLFKSVDGMNTWRIISPDLSTNDLLKTDPNTGGLTRDATGAETHCSITAIAESPLDPAIVWVGTDDGNVQLTRNAGATWTNVRKNISGVPDGIWVSSVEASHFDAGTAYVTFDGHRSDNFTAWVFKTSDFGATWSNISANLPANQPLYVVREDLKNRKLLFVGSEFAVHASLDGGKSWTRLGSGMPTVATHDLVIHPRDGDLIAGTHGRGIYVLDDITPLQQLTDKVLESAAYLFELRPATKWEDASRGGVRGHLFWAAENPPYIPANPNYVRGRILSGALISYFLKAAVAGDVTLEISELAGPRSRVLRLTNAPGIHRVLWDMRFEPSATQRQNITSRLQQAIERAEKSTGYSREQRALIAELKSALARSADADATNAILGRLADELEEAPAVLRTPFAVRLQGPEAEPGLYRLRLVAGGIRQERLLTVRPDPLLLGGN
jgi:photosystem II stability/assembly factor-like uncharacterized protein